MRIKIKIETFGLVLRGSALLHAFKSVANGQSRQTELLVVSKQSLPFVFKLGSTRVYGELIFGVYNPAKSG